MEERIEQPEVNDETQRTEKKKKKKKKKKTANFPIENEPPCENLNDKTINQNSSTLPSFSDENLTHLSGCKDETVSMEIGRSGDHESRDTQTIIDVQASEETTTACKNSSMLASRSDENSTHMSGCDNKTTSTEIERSRNHELRDTQTDIDVQDSKEISTACKDSVLDNHTTGDSPIPDLSMDIPEEESLVPSAKALSVALQGAAFLSSAVDCHSAPLAMDGTDALTKSSSEQHRAYVPAKANIDTMSGRIVSYSGVTESKLTHYVYANDPNDEDISEFNISSSAANIDKIVEEGSTEAQRCDIFTEENSQQSVGNDRQTSYEDEDNSNKRDLDLTHLDFSASKTSKPGFVISADSEERDLSAPEDSTHSIVTESEEKVSENVLDVHRCRKATNLSIYMINNSDVNVDESPSLKKDKNRLEEQNQRQNDEEQNDHSGKINHFIQFECLDLEKGTNVEKTSNEIRENTERLASGKTTVHASSLTDSKPFMPKVDKVVEAERDFGEASENETEREIDNTERLASSKTTLQASSLTDSKPVMLKGDEVVECDFGEAKKNENEWLRRVKSESVENVEVTRSVSQGHIRSKETHSQRESQERSGDTCLKRSAVKNERATMEDVISHSVAVSSLALKIAEQVERECINEVDVTQAQSVIDKTHLQSEKKVGTSDAVLEQSTMRHEKTIVEQMTTYTETVSRLGLNAVKPPKSDNENVKLSTCLLHAKCQAMEYGAVVEEIEPSSCLRPGDNFDGEDKSSLELEKATKQRLSESHQQSEKPETLEASPSDNSGDANKIMDPSSYIKIETESSRFAHICAEEDHPFCLSEEPNSLSVCLDGTSESEVQGISNQVSNSVNILQNTLERSSVGAPQVVTTATNNLDILAEENKLFDFVAPELVPIKSVNSTKSHFSIEAVSTETGKASNSGKVVFQGEDISTSGDSFSGCEKGKEFLHNCGNDCVKQCVEHHLSISLHEQSGNVKKLPEDQQLGTSQTVDDKTKFSGVEVTDAYSDAKKDKLKTKSDTLSCEGRPKDLDMLEDKRDVIKSLERETECIIGNLVNVPDKENDKKTKSGIDSFKPEANSNSKELSVESIIKSEDKDISFNKGADGGRGRMKTEEQSKVGKDNSLQNTIVETKGSVGIDEREEGEISSEEEDTSEAQKHKTEKRDTLEAPKPEREKGSLHVEKPKKEREEGELSSSDSDAEGLVETSQGRLGGARSKVVDDKTVLMKAKGLFPVRRHSSSVGHLTSSKKRSRLPESASSKRRASSSALQTTVLRTKLSEVRRKRISVKSKTEGVRETKSDGVRSGLRPVEINGKNPAKPAKLGNEKVPCPGKHVQSSTKGGHEIISKNIKLQQAAHVTKTEARKLYRDSRSSKEDKHTGKQSRREKTGHTPQSSKKATGKPNGSSQRDKKINTKSPRKHKIEDHSGVNQRDEHKTVRNLAAIRVSNSKKLPKPSQCVAPHKTEVNGNKSKGKMDTVAAEKKDDRQSKATKMSKDTHATSQSTAKTSVCSESNTENSSPVVKKAAMKKRTTMKLLRGKETAQPASSSVEKPVKPYLENKTTRKKAKLQPHPQTIGNKTATGSKQGSSGLISPRGKTQRKPETPCKVKIGTKSVGTATVGKVEHNDDSKSTLAKTAAKVSPRVAPRKVLKKSPANAASRAKAKPRNGNETRLENPRKRNRSVDGTDTKQSKRLRLDERNDSSSKVPLASSTIEKPKSSMKISMCNSNRENQPPCSRISLSGNEIDPVCGEKLKNTEEHKSLGDSKQTFDENADSIQTKPILIGRNKCLVFKRRHVNQLFVRGDNVVMVAYAK